MFFMVSIVFFVKFLVVFLLIVRLYLFLSKLFKLFFVIWWVWGGKMLCKWSCIVFFNRGVVMFVGRLWVRMWLWIWIMVCWVVC